MKWMNYALIGLAAAGLLTFSGCKKSAPTASDMVAVAAADSVKKWDKSEVNSLFMYVPESTPFVFGTTRNVEIVSPYVQPLLNSMAAGSRKALNKSLDSARSNLNGLENLRYSKDFNDVGKGYEIIYGLFEHYKESAAHWGLNPEGHMDSITYMNAANIVTKFTCDDGEKLKSEVDKVLNKTKIGDKTSTVKTGDDVWYLYSTSVFVGIIGQLGIEANKLPNTFAVNFGKTVVTCVFLSNSADTAPLEAALKPAEKALSKDAFNGKEDSSSMFGYIDLKKLMEGGADAPGIKFLQSLEILDPDEAAPCAKDLLSVTDTIHRINISLGHAADKMFDVKATLAIKDGAELAKLKALHAPHVRVDNPKSQASVHINIEMGKTLAYLKELTGTIKAKNYQCLTLSLVPDMLNEIVDLTSDEDTMSLLNSISGVNASVDSIDTSLGFKLAGAVVNVTGADVGSVYPAILALGQTVMPELSSLELTQGEEKDDMTLTLGILPMKLKGLLTETDAIYSTADVDLKAIQGKSKVTSDDFIDLRFTSKILMLLEDLDDDDLMVDPSKDHYFLSFGTDKEGIKLSFARGIED